MKVRNQTERRASGEISQEQARRLLEAAQAALYYITYPRMDATEARHILKHAIRDITGE